MFFPKKVISCTSCLIIGSNFISNTDCHPCAAFWHRAQLLCFTKGCRSRVPCPDIFRIPTVIRRGDVERGWMSLGFLTHPDRGFFISSTGRSIKSNSEGIKEQSFCCTNKSNHAGFFFSEFLPTISPTSKSNQTQTKLNFNCQCFEITKVIFHIKIANCWMDKLCNRRGLICFAATPPNQGSATQLRRAGRDPVFPL